MLSSRPERLALKPREGLGDGRLRLPSGKWMERKIRKISKIRKSEGGGWAKGLGTHWGSSGVRELAWHTCARDPCGARLGPSAAGARSPLLAAAARGN